MGGREIATRRIFDIQATRDLYLESMKIPPPWPVLSPSYASFFKPILTVALYLKRESICVTYNRSLDENQLPLLSDVSDEEWSFVVPYLTLMNKEASQPKHDLREVSNAPRLIARAGYDGYKRMKGRKVHMAVDTLDHLLAVQ